MRCGRRRLLRGRALRGSKRRDTLLALPARPGHGIGRRAMFSTNPIRWLQNIIFTQEKSFSVGSSRRAHPGRGGRPIYLRRALLPPLRPATTNGAVRWAWGLRYPLGPFTLPR
jgi:hypothetical protein